MVKLLIAPALLFTALVWAPLAQAASACDVLPTPAEQAACRSASVPSLKGVAQPDQSRGTGACSGGGDAVACCRQRYGDEAAFKACVHAVTTASQDEERARTQPLVERREAEPEAGREWDWGRAGR